MVTQKVAHWMIIGIAAFVVFVCLSTGASASAEERLAISVDVANVRSGPGTDHKILWRMERYTPIKPLDTYEEWIFFEDFEKTRGWMHKDLVDDTYTVITSVDRVNIRSSPGTEHDVIFRAESGVPFKALERRGEWIRIEHADGDVGWIHQSLVW